MKACCLLVGSLVYVYLASADSQETPYPGNGATYKGLGPPTSAKTIQSRQSLKACPSANLIKTNTQLRFPF